MPGRPLGARFRLMQKIGSLFDYFVSAADYRVWNCDAERLGGLEVYYQLDSCGLLYWEISWLVALYKCLPNGMLPQSPIRNSSDLPPQQIDEARRLSVRHVGQLAQQAFRLDLKERTTADYKPVCLRSDQFFECCVDLTIDAGV